jgi:TRAP-type mannitol/chloroaromatic compound transport system permease small subunit
MVAAGALGAVLRYLARPLGIAPALNALADLQWMLFSAVFLLGAAWALSTDAHVRVDVLYSRLSPRRRALLDLVGTLVLLLPFCALLLWATWPAVTEAVAIREGALDPGGLARWPVRLLVPLGLALLALQGVAQAVRAAHALRPPPPRGQAANSAA